MDAVRLFFCNYLSKEYLWRFRKIRNDLTICRLKQKFQRLDNKINQLKQDKNTPASRIRTLQKQRAEMLGEIYSNLSAWQTIQVARHPQRPLLGDYLEMMVSDFRELHGDRCFADDRAILTGFGQIGRERVLIVGHNKGKDTKEKIACNFGCAQS